MGKKSRRCAKMTSLSTPQLSEKSNVENRSCTDNSVENSVLTSCSPQVIVPEVEDNFSCNPNLDSAPPIILTVDMEPAPLDDCCPLTSPEELETNSESQPVHIVSEASPSGVRLAELITVASSTGSFAVLENPRSHSPMSPGENFAVGDSSWTSVTNGVPSDPVDPDASEAWTSTATAENASDEAVTHLVELSHPLEEDPDDSQTVNEVKTTKLTAPQLQNQLSLMSCRLLAAQNQIDRLLDEKRSWLENSKSGAQPNNSSASGELRGRFIQAKALAETYRREKENMVVKYAQSEHKRLQLEKQLCDLEARIHMSTKLTSNQQPKILGEPHSVDPTDPPRPAPDEQLRETLQLLSQTEKALAVAREQVETLKKSHTTDESRISSLEGRLKETRDSLKTEQKKSLIQNETIARLNRSLEAALKQAKASFLFHCIFLLVIRSEAERLREREAERLCAEVALQDAQEQLKRVHADNELLKEHVSLLDSLKTELAEKELRLSDLALECAKLAELRQDLAECKQHEDQLSEFTRRLTERNANLQSEHLVVVSRLDEAEQKLRDFERATHQTVSANSKTLSEQCARVQQLECQLEECRIQASSLFLWLLPHRCLSITLLLRKNIDHLRATETELQSTLATEREQSDLTHRRDVARIRDLIRQLARASQYHNRPHLSFDSNSKLADTVTADAIVVDAESVSKSSLGSRTSSMHSVELGVVPNSCSCTSPQALLGNTLLATGEGPIHLSSMNGKEVESNAADRFDEPERLAWIAKIDRLQKTQMRLTDKVEFLQEHCYQLTEELNKKSRIIQMFVMTEKQIGAASPNAVDVNRERISRTGGLMASLYTGKATKDTPDRNVCLEISQKLQSVLEDTLFKNITLKDNLNTLGLEISSLNALIHEIRTRLCEHCALATKDLKNVLHPATPLHASSAESEESVHREPSAFTVGGRSA
ncbi:uncharacterized protein DEA37_0006406 [Paragonimus westermani]|uniref:Coiled-coil domain-containing protein 186 n=1 Tax=Paragonimus westermani TaxID=34504 RepID=A0A5J4NFC4_9TREM|nr:uncharacterized protein DEA37_0006406 [Paragonimus westermani]